MSEIKPALTAEEWKNRHTERGYTFVSVGVDVWLGPPNDKDPLVMVQNRHAMAAICLHEQPFGFTRDMLRALRELGHPSQTTEGLDLAYAAIDRIEALLPPEEK